MHHGKQAEQVSFEGPGLRLLELKKAIVEKKAISGSLDFDLKVTDEDDPDKGGSGTNFSFLPCTPK
jgi:DWNN domain